MFINHQDLHNGMNTDDLCEVWFSFITYHGLEQEADECDNDAKLLLDYLKGAPICEWLDRYIVAWCKACDAEYSLGHSIQSSNGWHPPTN